MHVTTTSLDLHYFPPLKKKWIVIHEENKKTENSSNSTHMYLHLFNSNMYCKAQ